MSGSSTNKSAVNQIESYSKLLLKFLRYTVGYIGRFFRQLGIQATWLWDQNVRIYGRFMHWWTIKYGVTPDLWVKVPYCIGAALVSFVIGKILFFWALGKAI